ncbi:type VII secretion protein EccB [Actinosynnema sp. NPDC020468]|uniref:type VII secretion protein EccB n=1 Tax=Actinosynnema sp. NPDC020468 TaxID=3154488 RepID=UPI0033C07022
MNSKTDQVQAHRFMMGRLASALLRVDPDAPESPLHRTYRGSTIGGLIATLACVGVFIYGLISPGGNTSWKVDGALVVVDSSGARFLYADGKLLPVLNYASAKLVAGDRLVVHHVAENSLKDVPRGEPLGIVGAPDTLPPLAADPWEVCAAVDHDQVGATSLRVGVGSGGTALREDEAVVVVGPDGAVSVLWQGKRRRVVVDRGALDALDGVPQPVKAPTALVDALPVGPDFAPPGVADLGAPGPALGGGVDSRIGRLFSVTGGPAQRYVLTGAGLTPLSELDVRLLTADPLVRRAAYDGGEVVVTPLPGRVVGEHLSGVEPPAPVAPPRAVALHSGQNLCAQVTPDGTAPRTAVMVADRVAADGHAPLGQPGVTAPCERVDRVVARAGSAALVRGVAANGRVGDALYLVTDTGVRYPLVGDGAKSLGYDPGSAVGLPTSLLTLLPTGTSLDPVALRAGGAVLPATATCGS